jgi:hypothetical protein
MSLTKHSLAGNNLIIPGQGEFCKCMTSQLGMEKSLNFFTLARRRVVMELIPMKGPRAWDSFKTLSRFILSVYLHGGAEALTVLWLHPNDQDFWSHGFDSKSSSCKRKHTLIKKKIKFPHI